MLLLTAIAAAATLALGAAALRARAVLPAIAAAAGLAALAWAIAAGDRDAALVVLAVDTVCAVSLVLSRAVWRLLDD